MLICRGVATDCDSVAKIKTAKFFLVYLLVIRKIYARKDFPLYGKLLNTIMKTSPLENP